MPPDTLSQKPLPQTDDCACCGTDSGGQTISGLLARLLPGLIPAAEGVIACPLRQARGRVLAQDLVTDQPIPSFRRSAMDGYALRGADLPADDGPLTLPVRGRVAAGDTGLGLPDTAGAVRIFTGAAIPPDCDRVVMQEDCDSDGSTVLIRRLPAIGANIRLPGDDLAAGTVALTAGTRLDARHIACAASLGLSAVPVRRRLRVAVLSTGSELTEPGQPLRPGAIYNSNRFLLATRLEEAGFEVIDLPAVSDDPAQIRAALQAAAACDAVITSGGVSVGEEDHVKGAVLAIGGRIDHWRLAIKPGKPVAVGALPGPGGRETLFLGLPGNPNAVFVTLMLIGLPLLQALAGIPYRAPRPFPVRLAEGFRRKAGREEYLSVILDPAPDGLPLARRSGHGSSAQQSALMMADALMILPAPCTEAEAGTVFPALLLP